MDSSSWLHASLVFLAAAVLVVPLSRAVGLGSVIGYLAAGIVVGPFGLKLVASPDTVLHVAEFGVVLMLFLVGLELEPRRLWALRRPIFGWGTTQYLGCAALIALLGLLAGWSWPVAVAAALGLAMSSTAISLSVMEERNLLPTTGGQGVLSVALFQDVAAIPVMAVLPLMTLWAVTAAPGLGLESAAKVAPPHSAWWSAAKALGAVALIVLGGRALLRPALRWIARSRTPEIFTAAALLLVVATAALMEWVGLSMALGAFLAGVLLAESEYRRELETDLEPFKGLLLGLFFMAVGMSIDFAVVAERPSTIVGIVVAFLVVKALVLTLMARWMPIPLLERPAFVILLAQGGEFGFVVFQSARQAQLLDGATTSLLIAAVALSMLLTPLLLIASDRWVLPALTRHRKASSHSVKEIDEDQDAPILIAGFGRYGQVVGRLLFANGLRATVLEHDAEQVESVRRFGWEVHYGDATRLDLLRTAGAAQAKVLVVALDDIEQSIQLVDLCREHFPQLELVARARNVQHWMKLHERGVRFIERETLDAALMTGRSVLELMGWEPHSARQSARKFRRHNIAQLYGMAPHFKDESRLIAMAHIGRQQLEQLFAQERERHLKERQTWDREDQG